ncbi:hypothetical protein PMAYCL1PPCAC_07540, partial [Pristionchus mayeri]
LNPSLLPLFLLFIVSISYETKEITMKHYFGMMQSMIDDSEKLERIMYEDRQAWCTKWTGVHGPFSFDRYKETVQFLLDTDKTNRTHHPLFVTDRMKQFLESQKKKTTTGIREERREVMQDAQNNHRLFKFLCESMRVEDDSSD